MIEDQELATLFKAESEEHLQKLDEGLLHLEVNPKDVTILEEVFREAHSLKGAARMLGVTDVESIAHHFEDTLGAARRGSSDLTSDTIDRLYQGLDSIRQLVHSAVTDEPVQVDVAMVLARLTGEIPVEGLPEKGERASSETIPPADPASPLEDNGDANPRLSSTVGLTQASQVLELGGQGWQQPFPETDPIGGVSLAVNEGASEIERMPARQVPMEQSVSSAPLQIDTLRVEHQKLDELMTLAGELTVMAARNARRFADFEEILALWEECNKEAQSSRSLLRLAESMPDSGSVTSLLKSYQRQQEWLERLGSLLHRFRSVSTEDVIRLEFVGNELEEAITRVRLLPLSMVFNLFPRMVRDLSRSQTKEVQILIEGGATTADKRIIQEMKDPLMHMIRNAIDHGIESPDERELQGKPRTATIWLRSYQTETNIIIEIRDDGRGLNVTAIRQTALKRGIVREEELNTMNSEQVQSLIFAPGFSTSALITDVSGRGVGLDVVRENVERLKGSIRIESVFGVGCRFQIRLPITLATTRVLLVEVNGRPYAIPVDFVRGTLRVSRKEVFLIEGRETIVFEKQPVSIARLGDLLELRDSDVSNPKSQTPNPKSPTQNSQSYMALQACLILNVGDEQLGLLVDGLLDEQEIVLKPLGGLLKRVRNVAGATILGTGEVCMVLNPQDLRRTVRRKGTPAAPVHEIEETTRRQAILLVDDSITTRTQMKRIMEGAGYEVVIAVDGLDGLNKLNSRPFDGIVSDIQMPNMDGFTFTERIRHDPRNQELPVIMVTSLASDEDKRRGVEVGANAYITKGTFDQKTLLDTLRRLV